MRLLLSLERLGMKFGLKGISRLLSQLGDPHLKFPCIHIAGTNGKGSTASMLASALTSAGYRTGLYTSPHLVEPEERIRINGMRISKPAIAELTSRLHRSIKRDHPTFFETLTAIAFRYFADERIEIAVLETGLGGRLDSTNVVVPLVSVITNISLEHTEILGNSLELIAREKAGIIKNGVPCVTGVRDRKALSVIRSECRKHRAQFIDASRCRIKVLAQSLKGTTVDVKTDGQAYRRLAVSLPGLYQLDNLGIVVQVVGVLNRLTEFEITEEAMREGLANVERNSGLAGRLSIIDERPRIIVDVAHNAAAVARLVETLKQLRVRKPIVVFGVLRDKAHLSMVKSLSEIAGQAVAVSARSERSRPASDVVAAFESARCKVWAALSVEEGVKLALRLAGEKDTVLVTGSHYVVGEALVALKRKRT